VRLVFRPTQRRRRLTALLTIAIAPPLACGPTPRPPSTSMSSLPPAPSSPPSAGDVLTVISTNPLVMQWISGGVIDGGSPSSVYTTTQVIAGGTP